MRLTRFLLPLLIGLVLLPTSIGCSGDSTVDFGGFDVTPSDDIAPLDADPGDVLADVDADSVADVSDTSMPDALDVNADVAAADAGEPGDGCTDASDCATGYECVRPDAEAPSGLCTARCIVDSDCPDGWGCFVFTDADGDAERWCVPLDYCLDEDNDGYGWGSACRGRDCADDNPRINPAADERCNGVDDDCDDVIDENPVENNTDCETGLDGVCGPGRFSCNGGVLYCNPDAEGDAEEVCNGFDDDCNGEIDEGDVCSDTCCVADVCIGACAFGNWAEGGVCEPPDTVGEEVCDGVDNDCDGTSDESDPMMDEPCTSTELGACAPGVMSCVEGLMICLSRVDPRAETCNGEDDDCDGDIDEGGVCSGEPCCYDDICEGVCGTARTGGDGTCLAPADYGRDVCDGLDNDCDGSIDEDDPDAGGECDTGREGVCGPGRRVCSGGRLGCEAVTGPSVETCNDVDDDCDGPIDEGLELRWYRDSDRDGYGTSEAVLDCRRPDGYVATSGDCNDRDESIRPGALEVPGDGVDQNCNGTEICYRNRDGDAYRTDETFESADTDCNDSGEAGRTVRGGDCQDLDPDINPDAVEVCDGVDNDCDDRIDEGLMSVWYFDNDRDGVGVDSAETNVEACAAPGGYAAERGDCNDRDATVRPGISDASCNGVDNDCDGVDDEDARDRFFECCCDRSACWINFETGVRSSCGPGGRYYCVPGPEDRETAACP